MLDINWKNNITETSRILDALEVTDDTGAALDPDIAFGQLKADTQNIKDISRTIYFIGNGASASMASHVSADLEKNYHVKTEVFTDLSLITAIANDISYEEVFAEPLRRKMIEGDMLVSISSSGTSPNILKASRQAVEMGNSVITITGMAGDNPLRRLGKLNFYVPAATYGMAETCHTAILHFWVDIMTESLNT